MADATTFRLDTDDLAMEAGWQIEALTRIDEFSKDGVTIMVQYAADNEIESLTRSREGCADDFYGADSSGKAERLRIWLGVRLPSVPGLTQVDEELELPIAVQSLRARGMSRAAYIEDGADLQLLELAGNNPYPIARDYIRARNGGKRVQWHRHGAGSPHGEVHEVYWAWAPLPDGRVVGWFKVNSNFPGP